MKKKFMLPTLLLIAAFGLFSCNKGDAGYLPPGKGELPLPPLDPALVQQGQQVFRYWTFGDETFWTDQLHMNQVIETAVSPKTALAVGLKVDATALPAAVVAGIQNGSISLDDPSNHTCLDIIKCCCRRTRKSKYRRGW